MSLSVRFRHRFTNLELQIEFEAPTPGVVAFFGPSGCGKSTIVMAAAGLLQPDACRIDLDGAILADSANGVSLPPEKRRIGLVFQDARLFPHMSVRSNLRFGMRRAPPGPIRLDDVVDLLGIGHLLDRRPRSLSGGERQRVAIGRALLAQPKLLAMDEPLASLDGPRKAEILPFLARLKTALALPILYVTHSPEELASLADTLVLLDAGRVVAAGPLEEIMTRGDLPLANRDDAGAVLTARVGGHDADRQLTALDAGETRLWVPQIERQPGAMLRVRVPAREVILASEPPSLTSAHNVIAGRVREITPEPTRHETLVEIALDGGSLLARVTPDAVEVLGLAPGREVVAMVKSVSIEILPG
jgi:molybdate transport system ATP-binding protein